MNLIPPQRKPVWFLSHRSYLDPSGKKKKKTKTVNEKKENNKLILRQSQRRMAKANFENAGSKKINNFSRDSLLRWSLSEFPLQEIRKS